jgi:hypothetical protein
MCRSYSCQLICRFITNNTLMSWHPYLLNCVMSGQLQDGLVAVPDQFRGDLMFAKCFNCSLTVWQNVDVPIFVVPMSIVCWDKILYPSCSKN